MTTSRKPIAIATMWLALALVGMASCSKGYNQYADEYYDQGMIFYERMEYDRSIDSFSKVLELAPYGEENDRVFFMRGKSYLKSRQYDPAIYDFTRALDLTPEGDKAMRFLILEMRGDAFLGKSEAEKAIQDYSLALSLIPDHDNAKYVYTNRGWAFYHMGRFDAAINDFSRAIDIDADLASAYYARGRTWFKKGDSQRAMADAKEALRLRPDVVSYDDFIHEIRSPVKKP